jgi:two-component sensor histidine kinase
VKPAEKRDLREILRAITNPTLLSKFPLIAIAVLTVLVHLITSIDLGFRDLEIRAPIAFISILPAILLVWIAHRVSGERESLRFVLVLIAYLLGGAIRGALLERLLREVGVLQDDFVSFRIYAGMTIVASTFILVSYTWSTIQQAVLYISDLQVQNKTLTEALGKVREETEVTDREQLKQVQERIREELLKAIQVGPSHLRVSLEKVVNEVVRPLSQDFAREIKNWQPPSTEGLKLTPLLFWSYIDPVKHLRIPVVGITSMIIASIASLLTLLDLQDALQIIVGVSVSLLISSYIVFKLVGQLFRSLNSPLRDLVLTLSFIVMTIPAVFVQRLVLAGTENPDLYVVPTLVITPLFGWVILIGSAALGLSKELPGQLVEIRNDIRWAIARINLLAWYRRGVISRILHGPVQNSIHVAILRMKSADEDQSMEIMNEVISRIETSLREILDPTISPALELQTLESIEETWRNVAEISIDLTEESREAFKGDLASSSIVSDLVQEVCSNAIRHGGAQRINIEVDSKSGSIEILVLDDGTARSDRLNHAGLGSQFLDACSIEWQRRIVDGQNKLALRVPTSHNHTFTAKVNFGINQ